MSWGGILVGVVIAMVVQQLLSILGVVIGGKVIDALHLQGPDT